MFKERVEAFEHFLERIPSGTPIQIFCHVDADGLSAGVILERVLERLGHNLLPLLWPAKGQNAFSLHTIQSLAGRHFQALIVLDLGCKDQVITKGVPTLFIDHHRPYGIPPNGTLLTSYQDPEPRLSTAPLVFELCKNRTQVEDLLWMAAVGAIGDMGPDASIPLLAEAYTKYGRAALQETTILINAASRSSSYDCKTAASALRKAESPADLSKGRLGEAKSLQEYRQEVNREWRRCSRIAPKFGPQVALVEFSSLCDIAALVAQRWRGALPKYAVIAANHGYLEGKVLFKARTSSKIDLLELLERVMPQGIEERLAYGQEQAAGGIVDRQIWVEVVKELGLEART